MRLPGVFRLSLGFFPRCQRLLRDIDANFHQTVLMEKFSNHVRCCLKNLIPSDLETFGMVGIRPLPMLVVIFSIALMTLGFLPHQTLLLSARADRGPGQQAQQDQVSYDKQIRPILQAKCHGCHQPAKAQGDYIMTSFDKLLAAGESGEPAIVPGQPSESYLITQVTPTDGQAEMPKGQKPLADDEIALLETWIKQGAHDDTPPSTRQRFDRDHPPQYRQPPVITSLDYSPDGQTLAVAGFHEVLLMKADGTEQLNRLVGISERIESVQFSPDGKRLAVAGGLPARLGEVQIWDVVPGELLLSVPITYDTVYGGRWSPDGQLIVVGCADNSVRAIQAKTGEEVVYMAAHDDWVRDAVFSGDGKSILSVSRDKTVKLTDVATQRFVGNVTTHTPGILRGGQICIARHPNGKQILVGGADGAPKLFKMETKAAPAGGGNPNQIREYPALSGRVFDVSFSNDGTLAYAAASLNGASEIACYEVTSGKTRWRLNIPESNIYALAVSPDDQTLAAAGADGRIRLIEAHAGQLQKQFLPVEITAQVTQKRRPLGAADPEPAIPQQPPLPTALQITQLEPVPARIHLSHPTDYVQVILLAHSADGSVFDVTRRASWSVGGNIGQISPRGLLTPSGDGTGQVLAQWGERRVEVPVRVSGVAEPYTPDFLRDVNPVISKLGCNAGTCHGAAQGKNGFQLSLRGYDAVMDVRGFSEDLASRRCNVAAPDQSLMLLKATASVPHGGGQVTKSGSRAYRIIREWIGAGAKLDRDTPAVRGIRILPQNPVAQQPGDQQQMRVVATYADGSERDVTREAFIESGNTEIAKVDSQGLITALRRGEAPMLARYEGAYVATTLTVMGDRTGFQWEQPESWSRIDELVAAKWKRMKIKPSELCTDAEFIRRVSLDLTGLPPTAQEVKAFLADTRETQTKRYELIDKLIGSEAFVDYWTNKWADLLQVNRKFLGVEGAVAFRKWIRSQVAASTPYDQFARQLLTASGSTKESPPASYYKILREPTDLMENTTHLFLGVRFNCNKCHDHPFERWTQDQYYQTAAYFAQVGLKADPASGKKKVGGTAVEGAKPLYEIVFDRSSGEVKHQQTGEVTPPQFPFECQYQAPEKATRRQELAAWLTSADNPYFARSYVNRLWGYLLGVGIIEPIDDIRAGNPPTNPELLDHLTESFVQNGFDTRQVLRQICRSRTYQLSVRSNRWNADDRLNYSHATPRRLPAEVLYDTLYQVTGSTSRIPGVPPGTRAAALPDVGVKLSDGFLNNLGRPPRESACECERSSNLQLGPVMALVSGPTVSGAISDPGNALARLASSEMDDRKLVEEIVLRILNRPATTAEVTLGLELLQELPAEHQRLQETLAEAEKQHARRMAEQEAQRREEISQAEADLAAYQKKIAPRERQLEEKRQQRIAQAEAELQQYRQRLAGKLADWEKQQQEGNSWQVLEPVTLKATHGAKLAKQENGSILVTGPNGKGSYQVVAHSDLPVTGIRLEAFTDDRLPSKGPGRSPNGNFVLSELRLEWTKPAKPDGKQPDVKKQVALQNAQADFSQGGYAVATAIDGKVAATSNGWAIHPKTSQPHTAVFETQEDLPPGELTFWLDQQFQDGKHTLGKFRISITSSPRPIRLEGLPKKVADLLAVAPEKRDQKQQADLKAYFLSVDEEGKTLKAALAQAKKPRAIDPQLAKLKANLAQLRQPLPVDPQLLRLRKDVQMSQKQLANSRLTAAQDLAWALINTPAFLFNR